jgi:hypothetical protein
MSLPIDVIVDIFFETIQTILGVATLFQVTYYARRALRGPFLQLVLCSFTDV